MKKKINIFNNMFVWNKICFCVCPFLSWNNIYNADSNQSYPIISLFDSLYPMEIKKQYPKWITRILPFWIENSKEKTHTALILSDVLSESKK